MMYKRITGLAAGLAICLTAMPLCAAAQVQPNPVISRDCPVYSGAGQGSAAYGNDAYYYSFWSAQVPDYLAYDLSGVPEEQRRTIDAVFYTTSSYDVIGNYVSRNQEPSAYTIEVNAAPGGTYPEDGWESVVTVEDNALSSRQHVIDFEGYQWIRITVTGADGRDSGSAAINFDIHDVSDGVTDSWIFFGDSITAGGMHNCYGTGYATYVSQLDDRYFPIQENGGIGGITSTQGKENIDRWLSTFPGKYVSIAYGTNDAWGNQTGPEGYYENTVYMIRAVLDAGKVPVLPKIPFATEEGVSTYLDNYNAVIDRIYEEYPEVVQGPDFESYFREHPDELSDGVHPTSEGYDAMRQMWAQTMYERVYSTGESFDPGDVTADGTFGMADVVAMQKYLVRLGTLKAPECGDMNDDGRLDVLDLTYMKRLLTQTAER
ncbi:MAG: lysophospholipase [Oscillospiraceae bacterium]|nr:lysophospholipase [Oscillospiraceae bacterium]